MEDTNHGLPKGSLLQYELDHQVKVVVLKYRNKPASYTSWQFVPQDETCKESQRGAVRSRAARPSTRSIRATRRSGVLKYFPDIHYNGECTTGCRFSRNQHFGRLLERELRMKFRGVMK
ncbi:hypothetical protein CLF_106367 [Clonorchis sinensis]|uniref:Uncharacterized protein n=1 Tax=Clonorchis sinensis TaxID=79923 RepID=G7YF19_CLOSI|nr:hypothetical protein CLF_106367 [Clonorchis sinensis]